MRRQSVYEYNSHAHYRNLVPGSPSRVHPGLFSGVSVTSPPMTGLLTRFPLSLASRMSISTRLLIDVSFSGRSRLVV